MPVRKFWFNPSFYFDGRPPDQRFSQPVSPQEVKRAVICSSVLNVVALATCTVQRIIGTSPVFILKVPKMPKENAFFCKRTVNSNCTFLSEPFWLSF